MPRTQFSVQESDRTVTALFFYKGIQQAVSSMPSVENRRFHGKEEKNECFLEKFKKSANRIFFLRVGRKTILELESF